MLETSSSGFRLLRYSETKKYPHGRDFWIQNLTDFANLSKIYWVLEKNVLISIEALICGYFEPKKLMWRVVYQNFQKILVSKKKFIPHIGAWWLCLEA